MNDTPPPPADSDSMPLQFDRVEPVEPGQTGQPGVTASTTCELCKRTLLESYFEINGKVSCATCRNGVERTFNGRIPASLLLRATWLGALAAVLGAGIYFAIRTITGYEIGLIAIVVGALVGGAVRKGSSGRGGWQLQTLAIALTYSAIVSTYIPPLYKAILSRKEPASAESAKAPAPANTANTANTANIGSPTPTPVDTSAADASARQAPTNSDADAARKARELKLKNMGLARALGAMALAYLFLFALAAATPFLGGVSNLMGLFIIGIALYEAWKLNKRVPLRMSGPYRVGGAAPVGALPSLAE